MRLWRLTPVSCSAPPSACLWSPPSAESRLASAEVTAQRRRLALWLLQPTQSEDYLSERRVVLLAQPLRQHRVDELRHERGRRHGRVVRSTGAGHDAVVLGIQLGLEARLPV